MTMTFEQFQATRRFEPDLDAVLNDVLLRGQPGYVYLDALYIEQITDAWPAETRARGAFHLLIERDEWVSGDLYDLERRLYEFALAEGYETPADDGMTTKDAILVALRVLAGASDPCAAGAATTLRMLFDQRGCEDFDGAVEDGRLTTLCDVIVFG
jgi:hypothetical protein